MNHWRNSSELSTQAATDVTNGDTDQLRRLPHEGIGMNVVEQQVAERLVDETRMGFNLVANANTYIRNQMILIETALFFNDSEDEIRLIDWAAHEPMKRNGQVVMAVWDEHKLEPDALRQFRRLTEVTPLINGNP